MLDIATDLSPRCSINATYIAVNCQSILNSALLTPRCAPKAVHQFCVFWRVEQTLARVVESTERHFKAAGRRTGLPLPDGPIEDRDYFRLWPKVGDILFLLCGVCYS